MLFWTSSEIQETLRMIESDALDIRTVTMGISLRDCAAADGDLLCGRIEEKVRRCAERFLDAVAEVEELYGVPIVNRRIAVTPIAIVAESAESADFAEVGMTLDQIAREIGVDYIGGFSALVEKGATPSDDRLIDAIPRVLAETERLCASVNVASTRAGINMNAVLRMGRVIKETAERTAGADAIGCSKLVVFANAPDDNPFVAGAFHGVSEPDCVINVGVSGPGVVRHAVERLLALEPKADLGRVAETVKRMSFKITRAGELIGREVSRRLPLTRFGIVDLSLAPTPAVGDSVARILQAMGLEYAGAPGSTAALALLTDAVKKGGVMASSYVGGLSGAFIPVSEDAGMIEAVEAGALSIEKLEAMTAVCSVGIDMVAIPGDTSAETIAAIIADEVAIGMVNNKTTAVRIIPVPGRDAGEIVHYGGLLGSAPIMPVSRFDSSRFVTLGGRIPAPIHSLRN
ncbi:MAG: PFL family protein [Myxococcales bacterium]|nr:PFL family protein [Myxococcales bacterium]